MNILGLIFSLLLILSYGFFATMDKHHSSKRLRTTYIGHQKANRKLLNQYQSEIYKQLRVQSKTGETQQTLSLSHSEPQPPGLNKECAKLNLWPLIQEGREAHPFLYELTAKLLRTFYNQHLFGNQKRLEYQVLDALLSSARSQETPPVLEKLPLKTPPLQKLYYKMLKGTKEHDLSTNKGVPPLIDYVKIDPSDEKICLSHAHPDLIAVFFNWKIASKLYTELHQNQPPSLTKEWIEQICSEAHLIAIDPSLFDLLEFGRPHHKEMRKTLIATDRESQICLRKNVYLKSERETL